MGGRTLFFLSGVVFSLFFGGVATAEGRQEAPLSERAEEAFDSGRYKESIELYREAVEGVAVGEKGKLLTKLALAHYRDQEDVEAFSTFLRALETVEVHTDGPISGDERDLVEEALALYLGSDLSSPREVAVALRQKYASVVAIHPEYRQLGFFVAAAYANLGIFDEFFERFYESYWDQPSCYMAQKTKGVLHLMLLDRLSDGNAKEEQRIAAANCFQQALKSDVRDAGLYKLQVRFSGPATRSQAVRSNLQRIVDGNIVVPRSDIGFFVKEAVDAGEYQLARLFLDRAREWYEYSRAVNAAELLLDGAEPEN